MGGVLFVDPTGDIVLVVVVCVTSSVPRVGTGTFPMTSCIQPWYGASRVYVPVLPSSLQPCRWAIIPTWKSIL